MFEDEIWELHGMKVDLSFATRNGMHGRGKTIEYILRRDSVLKRLKQCGTIARTELEHAGIIQTIKAIEVKKQQNQPTWRSRTEADWPVYDGQPMPFIAQFDIPKNELTSVMLTGNVRLAVFGVKSMDYGTVFAITTQEIKFQSAEDHYRSEGRRG